MAAVTELEQRAYLGPEAGDAAALPGSDVAQDVSQRGGATAAVASRLTSPVVKKPGTARGGIGGLMYAYAVPAPVVPGTPRVRQGIVSPVTPRIAYQLPPTYIDPSTQGQARPLAVVVPDGQGNRVVPAAPPPDTVSVVQVLPQPKGLIL